MILHKIKPEQLESQELAVLVRRVKNLVRTSYSEYEKNYKTLSVLLKKIMKLSKEEKEWHVYFRAMHDLIYADIRISNYKEIVQLAEVYYKDSALYMDSAIPNYPGMNIIRLMMQKWNCLCSDMRKQRANTVICMNMTRTKCGLPIIITTRTGHGRQRAGF